MNNPLRRLSSVVVLLFAALFASTTYIQFVSADSLNNRPGNARTLYKEYGRQRGPIVVAGQEIARSVPSADQYQYQRTYPGGALYAPITGFYSVVFGETGMESAAGDLLAGTADQLFYRRISDLLTGRQPQGASVELTIDPKLQKIAYDALGSQRGAVVALDPKTGNILAMVSKPSYSPDLLASHDQKKITDARKRLLADPTRPLENRAISGHLYPPGSTFKLITAAAALSTGRYAPDTVVDGPAELPLPQTKINLPNDDRQPCGPGGQIHPDRRFAPFVQHLIRQTGHGDRAGRDPRPSGEVRIRTAAAHSFGGDTERLPCEPERAAAGPVLDRAVQRPGQPTADRNGQCRDR